MELVRLVRHSPVQLGAQNIEVTLILGDNETDSLLGLADSHDIAGFETLRNLAINRNQHFIRNFGNLDLNFGGSGEDQRAVGQRMRTDRGDQNDAQGWVSDRTACCKRIRR